MAALVGVRLVGIGMNEEAHTIDTTIWMRVGGAAAEGGDHLTAEEMLQTGGEEEVIALVLKEFEHGVIAVAGAGAEVEVGAGAGAVAGPAAAAAAPDAATAEAVAEAAAMKDVRGGRPASQNLIRWNPQSQNLGQLPLKHPRCLPCPQGAQKAMHFLVVSLQPSYQLVKLLRQDTQRLWLLTQGTIQLLNLKALGCLGEMTDDVAGDELHPWDNLIFTQRVSFYFH